MKKKYITALMLLFFSTVFWAQVTTTETFESATNYATSFTSNNEVFTITTQQGGTFSINAEYPGTGWSGTANDNRYIDNNLGAVTNIPCGFTINKSTPFKVNSMYLFLSGENLNLGLLGTLTLVGKLGGATVFTATKTSPFNNTSASVNNGYTFIDMTTFGGANNTTVSIDQLVITTTSNWQYVGLDAFKWTTVPASVLLSSAPTLTFTQNSSDITGDNIASDGEGGSQAISDINIQIYNISDTSGTLLPSLSWQNNSFMASSSGSYSALTYPNNDGSKGMAIKSADGSAFKLNQFIYYNWGETSTLTNTVKGYRNGSEVASTTFEGYNSGYSPTTITLPSSFENVDDVRVYITAGGYVGDQSATNHSINSIKVSSPVIVNNAPTVTTTTATGVGSLKATLGGNVTSDGGASVTERGIVWATTANPTTVNTKVTNGTGTGSFSALISSLAAGTLLHFRAYATNSVNTSYGSDLTFTTNAALSANTAQTNVSCNGGSNGTASVTAAGGKTTYTYSWSPSGGTAATASGLAAGSYSCTITDSESTQIVKNFTITQPTAISLTAASQTNITCNGGTNGAASVSATGGTPGYTYSWSPSGGTAASATGLASGTYVCTVTDANSCTASQSFTVTQPTAISLTAASQTNIACYGGTNGAASVSATGGTSGYTYSWSPSGGTAASATGLASGTYVCTVTDANGCTATRSFTITQPSAIEPSVTQSSGVLTATQTGAAYQWYNCSGNIPVGTNSNTFTPTQVGDYKVAISVGGCSITSACITVSTLGITTFETTAKLAIYPNPSKGIINVESDSNGDYQVINELGQIMKTFKVKANIINTIDLQNLKDSVYFIKEMNTKTKSNKLIIKK